MRSTTGGSVGIPVLQGREDVNLAAIDDVISRGQWRDWAELRRAVLSDRALLEKVEHVCRPYTSDPYAQRHHFWMHYAEEHRTAA